MKIISINAKVYKITDKTYNDLQKAAEKYNNSMHKATPDSTPYLDMLDKIEKHKPLLILDNGYKY